MHFDTITACSVGSTKLINCWKLSRIPCDDSMLRWVQCQLRHIQTHTWCNEVWIMTFLSKFASAEQSKNSRTHARQTWKNCSDSSLGPIINVSFHLPNTYFWRHKFIKPNPLFIPYTLHTHTHIRREYLFYIHHNHHRNNNNRHRLQFWNVGMWNE